MSRLACPCGRPQLFADCCGRYVGHFAQTPAPDAQALMRSRYSAYVLMEKDYLLDTWHPSMRPAQLELDAGAKWLGLEVRSRRQVDDTHAEVEFVARYRPAGSGKAGRLHERSRFVKENGRWFYVDGDML
jgi:SEC-C motif-containing protein